MKARACNEDQQGRPFVGRAGGLLVELLGSIGWRREDVFITNVVKCRPPGNRDPEPDEIAACAPYLRRQLEALDPALVVTARPLLDGHVHARACASPRPTARPRQSTRPPVPATRLVFAMYHPAAALRTPASSARATRTSRDPGDRSLEPAEPPGARRDVDRGRGRARATRRPARPQAIRARPRPHPRPHRPRHPITDAVRRRIASADRRRDPTNSRCSDRARRTPCHRPDPPLRIIPLGGVGEIGKNMYVFEYGDEIVVIDCGLMFPDEEMFGIDLVIPDVTYLKERRDKVKAFLITHAHEDHVGGLPYVLPEFPGVPDLRLAPWPAACSATRSRSTSSTTTRCWPSIPGDELDIGPFTVIPFRVGHSIPDAMGIALRTPVGTIVHTGDFKFDHTPVDGKLSDFAILAKLGEEGVACLLSDSTRAENPGYTPSERTVGEAFREIMEPLDGRVIVATFASNIARIQQVLDAAADMRPQRRRSSAGRWSRTSRIATDLGYLKYDASTDRGQGQDQGPSGRQARHRDDRRAGRADGRPGAHGQPRPPLRRDPARRHGHRQRQPDPGQRGVRLAHDRQPVQGRRERLLPHDQARARLRSRQPGGAQADARADQAEALHPDPRRVPDAGPARPPGDRDRRRARERVHHRERHADRALRRRHAPGAAARSPPATSSSTACRSATSARSSCATDARSPTTACS